MNPIDIMQAVAVAILTLIALIALVQVLDRGRYLRFPKRGEEKHEVELPGLREADDSSARD